MFFIIDRLLKGQPKAKTNLRAEETTMVSVVWAKPRPSITGTNVHSVKAALKSHICTFNFEEHG